MERKISYVHRLSADADVSHTKAVRIGAPLRILMHDIAEMSIAEGCELSCNLKPIELWAQAYAKKGFEVAMMLSSEASWHA